MYLYIYGFFSTPSNRLELHHVIFPAILAQWLSCGPYTPFVASFPAHLIWHHHLDALVNSCHVINFSFYDNPQSSRLLCFAISFLVYCFDTSSFMVLAPLPDSLPLHFEQAPNSSVFLAALPAELVPFFATNLIIFGPLGNTIAS